MLSRITQKLISVGVIAALLIMTMQAALGAPAQSQPKPSDFFWEEVGMGMLGEVLGAALGFSLFAWVDYGCPGGILNFFGMSICKTSGGGGKGWTTLFGGLIVGIPVGASLGAILIGSQNGVQGSIIFTVAVAYVGMIGSMVGMEFVAMVVSQWVHWVNVQPGFTIAILLGGATVLAVTAIGATIGYNNGAKMKADKSKPAALSWHMPLISVKF
ncbi:hypothetical protein HYR54_04755 [Candidatus Acetothermia bacterium]|nr:hypothetical protein [Candidatus Acetothermia bacterium]